MRGAKSKEETLSRSPEETVELILPSEIDSATQIEQVVEQMALRAGFDEDAASSIAMATREAAINAVKHGNKLATDKSVSATLNRTGSSLTVKITDQGEGLDPEAIPDPLDAKQSPALFWPGSFSHAGHHG